MRERLGKVAAFQRFIGARVARFFCHTHTIQVGWTYGRILSQLWHAYGKEKPVGIEPDGLGSMSR